MEPYRDEIDHAIFDILYFAGPYRYRVLKRILERHLNCKNLSFNTFDNHIDKMVIGRKLEQNGRFYSLTRECRLEYKSRMERGEKIDTKSYNSRNWPIDMTAGEWIKYKKRRTINQVQLSR